MTEEEQKIDTTAESGANGSDLGMDEKDTAGEIKNSEQELEDFIDKMAELTDDRIIKENPFREKETGERVVNFLKKSAVRVGMLTLFGGITVVALGGAPVLVASAAVGGLAGSTGGGLLVDAIKYATGSEKRDRGTRLKLKIAHENNIENLHNIAKRIREAKTEKDNIELREQFVTHVIEMADKESADGALKEKYLKSQRNWRWAKTFASIAGGVFVGGHIAEALREEAVKKLAETGFMMHGEGLGPIFGHSNIVSPEHLVHSEGSKVVFNYDAHNNLEMDRFEELFTDPKYADDFAKSREAFRLAREGMHEVGDKLAKVFWQQVQQKIVGATAEVASAVAVSEIVNHVVENRATKKEKPANPNAERVKFILGKIKYLKNKLAEVEVDIESLDREDAEDEASNEDEHRDPEAIVPSEPSAETTEDKKKGVDGANRAVGSNDTISEPVIPNPEAEKSGEIKFDNIFKKGAVWQPKNDSKYLIVDVVDDKDHQNIPLNLKRNYKIKIVDIPISDRHGYLPIRFTVNDGEVDDTNVVYETSIKSFYNYCDPESLHSTEDNKYNENEDQLSEYFEKYVKQLESLQSQHLTKNASKDPKDGEVAEVESDEEQAEEVDSPKAEPAEQETPPVSDQTPIPPTSEPAPPPPAKTEPSDQAGETPEALEDLSIDQPNESEDAEVKDKDGNIDTLSSIPKFETGVERDAEKAESDRQKLIVEDVNGRTHELKDGQMWGFELEKRNEVHTITSFKFNRNGELTEMDLDGKNVRFDSPEQVQEFFIKGYCLG